MAIYRHIQVSFWQDSFVMDLTPEEKYFYLYLMTNAKTSQCGCYELTKKIAEVDTGYNRETVEKLLKRFEEYGKIKYSSETNEILIVNWLKHNFSISPAVLACLDKEIQQIKNDEFRDCVETVYRESIESRGKKKNKKKNKNSEYNNIDLYNKTLYLASIKEKEKDVVVLKDLIDFYNNNIGIVTEYIYIAINDLLINVDAKLILRLMQEAVTNNKLSWSYVNKAVTNNISRGVTNLEQYEIHEKERKRNSSAQTTATKYKNERVI